jgi:TetR/AcrR family transcriptional regulator, cholesterol catabolism regulator
LEGFVKQQEGLRQKKNAQVKDALYKTAMQLFRQQGFEATTVDEIAAGAGYSRATFFNHFGTKQGVLRHYGKELRNTVEEIVRQPAHGSSSLDVLHRVLLAMIEEAKEHLEDVRIICTYSVLDPSYITNPTPSRRRITEIIIQLVSKAQEEGRVRTDLNATDLGFHILLLYQGVVFALVTTGVDNADSLQYSMWQFILGGLHSDNPDSR